MTPDIKKTPEATNNLAGVFPFSGLRVFGSSGLHAPTKLFNGIPN